MEATPPPESPLRVAGFSDLMQEQYRLQMIEQYRQTCAMHFAMGMLTKADHDEPIGPIIRRAKSAADALVQTIFEQE